MILPSSELHNACQLGLKWLADPNTKILYVHENGCVLENNGYRLTIANGQVEFTTPNERKPTSPIESVV